MRPGSESEPHRILALKASELPTPHTAEHCRKCSCEDGYLGRYIQSNNKVALRWVCDWCEDYGTAGDLPQALLGDLPLEQLPLRVDRSHEPGDWPECEVCGQPAEEFHHWAPSSIFPEWPYTLGNYLCKAHHDEWHNAMRAHGLRWPHELEDVS